MQHGLLAANLSFGEPVIIAMNLVINPTKVKLLAYSFTGRTWIALMMSSTA
jgi:hypothetical protein